MPRSALAGLAPAVAAVALATAAALGLSTRHVELNLGPGDTPFVSGFQENSDVEDKVGWHWTTYHAGIDLPFATHEADLDVMLRYARVFGEEAVVDVSVAGARAEPFKARGGEVRATTLRVAQVRGPVRLTIDTDSHERRDMGLKLDRLAIDVVSGEPLRLRGFAALRPIGVVALLFLGLSILGASPLSAGWVTLVAAAGFAAAASVDLFAAWRQLSEAPLMLVVSTLVLLALKRWMERAGVAEKGVAVTLAAAALVTMLLRLTLVFHPDFYYPDLLTHTRVADAIRVEGPRFFLHPADALNSQGAWTKPVLGSVSSLPYAVMFHTPFAILASVFALSVDQIETSMKAGAALISVLPILLSAVLAARLSLPPLAALMLCVIPTYTSRLSFALMPALLGHVFDLLALLALANLLGAGSARPRRALFLATAALLAGHLSYTSSVVNEGFFVLVLSICCLAPHTPGRGASARVLMAESGAALLAFVLYYRHFVADVFGLALRLLGFGARAGGVSGPDSVSASVYPIESFWRLLFERTDTFFGWSYIAFALVGLVLAGRMSGPRVVLPAWGLTYLLLILVRAKIPDVFRYGHETLFLTPLVALLAGAAVIEGLRKGGAFRLTTVMALAILVIVSCGEQWMAMADQFGNAR